MSKRLVDLYKDWADAGRLSCHGLCNSVPEKYIECLNLFYPTEKDFEFIVKKSNAVIYWGSGVAQTDFNRYYGFTPLRQTIVLLICAMHNEI